MGIERINRATAARHARRLRLLSAAAAPLCVLAPQAAFAQSTISTETTTPYTTSAGGTLTIVEDGSITVSSGSAVTVDSNADITVEDGGEITTGTGTAAAGITVQSGTTSTILNDGTITVTEDFTAADDDANGIADGPIAKASGRYGIHVLADSASGSITNSGTITLEGLNSAGIAVDAAYTGDITNSGTITVKGDYSVAIRTGAVSGDVEINGTVAVIGEGAQGVVLDGDIGGTFSVQGTISQSVSYTTDDSTTQTLSRTDLRSGAATVSVRGSVAGGILIEAPPYDLSSTSTDEDGDGVTDSSETTGAITSVGESPALAIGGTTDIVIGSVTGRDGSYALAIDGTVSASAVYSAMDATAIVIGGEGGSVSMPDGIGVSGSVSAATYDSAATAILIHAGSTVPTLYNSGTISASISSPGEGTSGAIRDLSGTLTTIENTGFITVSGSSEDTLSAIDLSANTTGVTIRQYLNATDAEAQAAEKEDEDYDPASGVTYTMITGDIRTGSGDDLMDFAAGRIVGDSVLGAGDDRLLLSGDAIYIGDVDFGTGTATMDLSDNASFTGGLSLGGAPGTLTVADTASFLGTIDGGSALAVTVSDGGTFGADAAATSTVDTLNIGAAATFHVYIDSSEDANSLLVANVATFSEGATLTATVTSLEEAVGSYTVLSAGALTGAPVFDDADFPFLLKGSVVVEGNDLILDIDTKTAAELGLNRSLTQGYDALLAAGAADEDLSSSFLEATDAETLQGQFEQLLPDSSGGVFDIVTRGARQVTRHLHDESSMFDIDYHGGWLEPILFRGSKDAEATPGFRTSGWGLSGGLERITQIGYLGGSLSWISGSSKTGDWQTLDTSILQASGFWRVKRGGLIAYAQVAAGLVDVSSDRTFTGTIDETDFTYAATAKWKGWTASATAGASYTVPINTYFSLKPMGTVEYFRLHEDGYEEDGDDAIVLDVESRTSDSITATPSMTLAWTAGPKTPDFRPLTVELEAGHRFQLGGTLGTTTAAFIDGERFSITPDALKSGWTSEARMLFGGMDYTFKLSAGAEQTQGGVDYSGGLSVSLAF